MNAADRQHAVTLAQPHPALILAGVQTLIVWPRPVEPQRIWLHADETEPDVGSSGTLTISGWRVQDTWAGEYQIISPDGVASSLPLGALVGSCQITACVPIHDCCTDPIPDDLIYTTIDDRAMFRQIVTGDPWAAENVQQREMTDQLPFIDPKPGMWALLLTDPQPCTPKPMRGRRGLWAIPESETT